MFKLLTPRWPLSLLLLLLFGAGCHNTRTAFQFRRPAAHPAPAALAPAALAPAALASSPVAPTTADGGRVVAALAAPAGQRAARKRAARPRLVRRLTALATQIQVPTPPLAGNRSAPGRRLRSLLRPRHAALAPAGTAESGLGTTFLGIVGILALVVGLIGLIFAGWGFFGWLAVGGAVLLLISILAPYVGNGHA